MSLSLFRRIVLAAACAGLAAGAALTAIQTVKVLPLIAAAERYEAGGAGAHAHGPEEAEEGAEAAGDAHGHGGGAPRLALTLGANAVAGVAFALLLVAALSFAAPADWRKGLAWGAAGFVAFSLAPAAGLPPKLPGAAAADLADRQLWWAATAAATAGGLALLAFAAAAWTRAAAAALIALPHVVGAPGAGDAAGGPLPADLAASFVGASLAANLVFWLIVGGLGAWTFIRLEPDPAAHGRSPGR